MSQPNVRFDFGTPPADPAVDPTTMPEVIQDPVVDPVVPDPANPGETPPDPVVDPNLVPDPNAVSDPTDPPTPDPDPASEPTFYEDLGQQLGMDVEGEFADDVPGMVQYIKAASEKMSSGALQSVFEAFPDVQDFLAYRQNGGEANKFFQAVHPETDYGAIKITPEDVGTQREVIRTLMRHQNHDEAYINETLSDYAAANILEKHAKHAQTSLTGIQTTEAQAEVTRVAGEAETNRTNAENNWKDVQATVATGTLGNVIIPEAEKSGFLDWMSKPVDSKGTTRRELDRADLPTDTALLLEYMIYKKADVSKLVVNKARTKNAKALSQRLGRKGVNGRMDANTAPTTKKPDKLPGLDFFFNQK